MCALPPQILKTRIMSVTHCSHMAANNFKHKNIFLQIYCFNILDIIVHFIIIMIIIIIMVIIIIVIII